jgi:hypothetical protein
MSVRAGFSVILEASRTQELVSSMKTFGNDEAAARTDRRVRDAGQVAQAQPASGSLPAAATQGGLEDLAGRSPRTLQLRTRAALIAAGPASLKLQRYQRLADGSTHVAQAERQGVSTSAAATVQCKIKVGTISVTKHNFAMQCEREKGKLYEAWNALTPLQRAHLEPLIMSDDFKGQGDTFLAILEADAAATATAASSSEGATGAPPTAPQTFDVPTPQGPIRMRILNDSGGYHLILEHPDRPDIVIRHRREGATPLEEGLANLEALRRTLRRRAVRTVRAPVVDRFTDNAYEVERVDGAVDGLALWQRLKSVVPRSAEHVALSTQLQDIRDMFVANIEAAHEGTNEPFPDFRPANVGVKTGSNELVYIDFDQRGVAKGLDTLADQAMEWAGRRYEADPGGPRDADPEFFKFVTGERLAMPSPQGAGRGQKRRNAASNAPSDEPSPAVASSSSSRAIPSTPRPTPSREVAPHDALPLTSSSVTASDVRPAEATSSNEKVHEGQSKKRKVEVSENPYVQYQGYHWTPDFAHWYDHELGTWRDRIEQVAPGRRYDWYEGRYV